MTNTAQPALSDLAGLTIVYGTSTVTLSGSILAGSTVPPGSASITLDGDTQSAAIGTSGSFSAVFNTASLGVAGSPYTISYAYAASGGFLGVTDTSETLTVSQATPTVSVTAEGLTYDGSPIAATPTVTGVSGIAGPSLEGVYPTLAYYAGSTATGTPLGGAPSTAGTYTVVATFPGSTDYGTASSSPVTFTIARHATTATLVASTPEGAPGQAITFTATVAGGLPSPYLPTGSVQFQVNGVNVGSPASLTTNDAAAFSTTEPASGSFKVTAVYSGDTNFAVSQSTYTETVLSPGVYAVGTTLYVVGANTSDYALISPWGSKLDGSTGLAVVATLNNAFTAKSFNQTFTAIDVFGYGGNDSFLLIPTLTLPTTVVEGNGNNYVLLAAGNDSVTLGSVSSQVLGGNGNKRPSPPPTPPAPGAISSSATATRTFSSDKETTRSSLAPATTPSPPATATTMSRRATATTP